MESHVIMHTRHTTGSAHAKTMNGLFIGNVLAADRLGNMTLVRNISWSPKAFDHQSYFPGGAPHPARLERHTLNP